MNPKLIVEKISKYINLLSELNKQEGWGAWKSIMTYVDFLNAYFVHGCFINQYINGNFYSYKGYYRRRVITQKRLDEIIDMTNSPAYIHLFENKVDFNTHFKKWVRRKWLNSKDMTLDDFKSMCTDGKALFIKPIDSYEGKGIRRISAPLQESEMTELYKELEIGSFIIEQELEQHHQMIFGNKCVNTLRINTLLDKNGDVHFFKPVLRTGVGDAFVDNYNAGGVEYAVDFQTGIITMPGYMEGEVKCIYHPGTNIKMVGYQIPKWNDVISNVTEAAKHIPQCRFIGWDVAITPEGVEFIEGNHNPGYVCMEYFGETGWYGKLKKYL